MIDKRVTDLANVLVNYSIELSEKDTLLLHAFDVDDDVIAEIIRVAKLAGANVMLRKESAVVRREMLFGLTEENAAIIADNEMHEMKLATAYIGLRGWRNVTELSDVPADKMSLWNSHYRDVLNQRVNDTKWVVLRWPNPSMAQLASMSTRSFEDFYFRVCNFDYAKLAEAAKPLKHLMDNTDEVCIKGNGTDITFSIKGIGSMPCVGERNIPDGECYSCPVKNSVNGTIQYNVPSVYNGIEFNNVRLVVKEGKIVEAYADGKDKEINEVFDTDEGARYFGEFAIGFNPEILYPMKDILFDEKIAGSLHLTPGKAYEDVGNGNVSAIHWDLVLIQRADYGGGEIWMDGKLVRKDGLFVLPELQCLNPEELKK